MQLTENKKIVFLVTPYKDVYLGLPHVTNHPVFDK